MDDQAQRCWYSPSGVERRGSKAMLRAAGHVDAGYLPPEHRVQSPTSGAWHPCQCSRGEDHVGAMVAGDPTVERWVFRGSDGAMAVLTAPQGTVLPDDPAILTMPADWANMCDWASDPEMILLRED